jgi:hypothetical protein
MRVVIGLVLIAALAVLAGMELVGRPGKAHPARAKDPALLAALINAYHEAVRRSPPRRPGPIGFVAYFFLDRHPVMGHSWTLWRLEEEIRSFHDPRVHFALNCGAVSCPPIHDYDPVHLDQQLDMATRNFLENEQGVRIDVTNRTVYLSSLFKWYRKDFGDPVRFIEPYLTPEQHARLRQVEPNPAIRYLPWDWSPVPLSPLE